jgi:GTP-binding protein
LAYIWLLQVIELRFVDEVTVWLKAGKGGNGAVAWRREKFIPQGGPFGGDGGNGGSVVLVADESVRSLLDFRFHPEIKAKPGENGRTKNQFGKNGEDVIRKVPVGTQVFDADNGELLVDLDVPGKSAAVCRGGSGGWGNSRFATATRQAPDFAYPGTEGEERRVCLSLKLMADVGLLGMPNAGKSTLLSVVSAARPKIANYPFTTLTPQLGVVQAPDDNSFVMADIPGLIEGASEGAGLGFRFLKHLERVRVLCHLVEPGLDDAKSPLERYLAVRHELENFSSELAALPELVVFSKCDVLPADKRTKTYKGMEQLKKYLEKQSQAHGDEEVMAHTGAPATLHMISAASGQGVPELVKLLWRRVSQTKS